MIPVVGIIPTAKTSLIKPLAAQYSLFIIAYKLSYQQLMG